VTGALSTPATPAAELESHVFAAMGTDVELYVEAEDNQECRDALSAVEAEFHRLDALLSRFRADSELSRLNRHGALAVSSELLELTELALAARVRTGGRFDPTVHDALVAEGYDRTFKHLPADVVAPRPARGARCGGTVMIDREQGVVALEPGFGLDFGGIAKGYAAERTCDSLFEVGPCLVNAGGDLAVRGSLQDFPWLVGVDTPAGPITLALRSGAMATSGCDRRRWLRGGKPRHHLIDPSTGRSAESDLLHVTVVASSAIEAEVLAKSLFLAGERQAIAEASEHGVPCLLVTADGRVVRAGGLE
jgi:thiamine biosynthesis lipoprotein